jgi:histidine kinase-like protein
MIRRWLIRLAAISSIAVCVAVAIVDGLRGWPDGGFLVLYGVIASIFVVVGWLIAERQPSNATGPLLLLFGAAFAWYLPAELYLHLPGNPPGAIFAALFISMLDAPMFILIAVVLIVFPDGHLPSSRWRWTIQAALIGGGAVVGGYLLEFTPLPLYPSHRSPIGIAGFPGAGLVYVGYAIMLTLLGLAATALVIRWRRGGPAQRAQVKWVLAAALILLVTALVNVATFNPVAPNAITTVLASIGIALVPIAMGIAILRYRLYEIDRIISRTLSYAVVTAILGAVFVGVILLLQAVLAGVTGNQGIPVAISTLAVFALVQPVLRRVRHAVDRRFDRARYDGERTVSAFAERLRWETDRDRVIGDLLATVDGAVAPTSLGVWLRTDGGAR